MNADGKPEGTDGTGVNGVGMALGIVLAILSICLSLHIVTACHASPP